MFYKQIGTHLVQFNDEYIITLKQELYGQESLVLPIIEQIFNLSEVLILQPKIQTMHKPDTPLPQPCQYIVLEIDTVPTEDYQVSQDFAKILQQISGVSFAQPKKMLVTGKAATEYQQEHTYGGRRVKHME